MRRFVLGLAITAVAGLSPSLGWAGDRETADGIAKQLKSSGQLVHYSVGVSYKDGTAWLKGTVANPEQMATAVRLTEQISGVNHVVNQLQVATPAADAAVTPASQLVLLPSTQESAPVAAPAQQSIFSRRPQPARVTPAPVSQTSATEAMQAEAAPVRRAVATGNRPMGRPIAGTQQVPAQFVPQGGPQGAPPAGYRMAAMPMGAAGGSAVGGYDQPHLPNYAWPSYAAYPNYAAVTYPKQYSPTAWPYIGPFYPYPQVPLGWRKVSLEWDDGWWFLDFDNAPCH